MILVIGDAMIDRYWTGDVERISPEAPVPVIRVEDMEERQGGAANVAANIAAMGAPVKALYSPSFADNPVVKLRIIGRSQQMVRIDFDTKQDPITLKALEDALKGVSIVVVSDYGKGALSDIDALVSLCVLNGKRVLVDPKGYRYAKYRGAALVKPNLTEMKELVGGWADEDELSEKVEKMRADAQIGAVLLTRGAQGMTLYDGQTTHFPAQAREVYDVSGAGDTAIAAFAVSVHHGKSFADAAFYANFAAGIAVGHFGTAVVKKEEVFG